MEILKGGVDNSKKDSQPKSVELLTIKLPLETELRLGPSSESELLFARAEKPFEICPSPEQTTPNLLKIRNKEDNSTFYLIVPEVEKFPCPVKHVKPEDQAMSLYEVMIILLKEWEKGNTYTKIISSIDGIFGKIGQIQNPIIQSNFYDEAPRT